MKKILTSLALLITLWLTSAVFVSAQAQEEQTMFESMPRLQPGQMSTETSVYVDTNGDVAIVPKDFCVSTKADEQTISTGVVVIGPDGSEFVWVPTTSTVLAIRDLGSYVSWGSDPDDYWDETDLPLYQAALRDPLPGNGRHPNVVFRVALFIQ